MNEKLRTRMMGMYGLIVATIGLSFALFGSLSFSFDNIYEWLLVIALVAILLLGLLQLIAGVPSPLKKK
ncbi:hypothetical protein J2S78_000167 [Salibacterium salarium]|uniref:Uncharacterized protein n=2 Tax=Salibacterium salarium TaxID=284579 RepID=A0A3R9P434_9BACI|nr:hypothetical protein [Salibacterium salarium]MDQ0297759.1 hypothetical protein [Salibacterium salarium]RSL30597.1 hypothetical protein D7Z54_24860 [Salibacterium salarium]